MENDRSYAWVVELPISVPVAVERATEALSEQGFGVLTRIDAHEVLKKRIGIDRAPYVILGACNPTFAHQAIEAEPAVGILLPCNVVVEAVAEAKGGGCRVWVTRPDALLAITGRSDIAPLAAEVGRRLAAVVSALQSGMQSATNEGVKS